LVLIARFAGGHAEGATIASGVIKRDIVPRQ